MQQLTGLDATFLYLETPNAPMHIGGVSILAAKTPTGRLELETVRELLRTRCHTSRAFTQKLVDVPLKLGKPYWTHDEDFDVANHIHRTQLPAPGGWKELSALAAWEFSQILPRDRPLWDLLLVEDLHLEGYPEDTVALISRIHHAAIDGVSGSEILSALFDITPEPRQVEATALADDEKLGKTELLRRAGSGLLGARSLVPKIVGDTVKAVVKSGAAWGLKRIKPPPVPFSAPRTRWNAPVTKERVWSPARLRLDRVKALRKATGATVNDVVLAVCAGALRRDLLDHHELPEKPLVAMVPVSVREEDGQGTMGNQVSAMLVALATDVEDPAERLNKIRHGANRSKVHHEAIGARTLSQYSELVPFGLAGLGARLYSRSELATKHRPIFNLVITNVPGPQIPLYAGGAKLLAHGGTAPIFDGMGLILPVFSYAGSLTIGATSCRKLLPDIHRLTSHLGESLDELEEAFSSESLSDKT